MMNKASLAAIAVTLVVGCGPTKLQVRPTDVVNVNVRPASGQLLFCPGDPFQVEVVARMKDGTTCSSVDDQRGCLGEEGVIDPTLIRITGSSGTMKDNEQMVWLPDPDPLATAGTGLDLKAWLESRVGGTTAKSDTGESHLKPVYQCYQAETFGGSNPGAPGPTVEVAVTTLSTPYYPNAALVRVSVPSQGFRFHFISANVDSPVRIVSAGARGATGRAGVAGTNGTDGTNGSSCQNGGNGTDGGDGGDGGPGGDGGAGGLIRVVLDESAADELRGRIVVESVPGGAGFGGSGGSGGQGGRGGDGGSSNESCPNGGLDGQAGRDGRAGQQGPDGRPGAPGPPPEFATAPRDAIFSGELSLIKVIEAKKARRE